MGIINGTLTIDLQSIAQNYKALHTLTADNCKTAPSVKANAYGLGAKYVVPALQKAGAEKFFVATLDEAIEIRILLPHAHIYVLNGFLYGARDIYQEYNLIPVLNSLYDIDQYKQFSAECNHEQQPALLHFDTGINRLGLCAEETKKLCDDLSILEGIDLHYIMSHFSSSDEQNSPVNAQQYHQFQKISSAFPNTKKSLCNSGGIFLSSDYHMDLTRPGIALYGGKAVSKMDNTMKQVVSLSAPIIQIKAVKKGSDCGYNGTYRFDVNSTIAIVSSGYADGIFRSLGNRGALYYNGYKLPIRGRVSMDLIICDLTNIPEQHHPNIGDMVEIIGRHQTIDDLAKDAGTISYEIITSLGARYDRIYI